MRSNLLAGLGLVLLASVWQGRAYAAQDGALTVNGSIVLSARGPVPSDRSGVAVWLIPAGGPARATPARSSTPQRFQMVQRGKRFRPRVLVVPVGSVVSFPNFDPILHNVFSLFEGKRFDLGLYEAGTSRTVTFASPGVSHVFCNIHPEMSAVVVAVDSDYYATSDSSGAVAISDVPPGRYWLNVWHERFKPESDGDYPRDVTIAAGGSSLAELRLVDDGQVPTPHKNKFGHDYIPPDATAPAYLKR